LALLHALSAVVVLILLSGVSGAVTGRTDRVAQYLEGFAYLALIIVAVYLVAEATHDLIAGKSRHANAARSVGALLITGIYPCPGAILVMVLALALDIKAVGAAAVLAMSLGMSLPIVAAGYLAWFGRAGLFSALKRREAAVARAAAAVELTGYLLLLAFAAYMAYPFAVGLLG
jgi:ABC-type nickel/cobalt efflux system permease component RcnA